ncbi:hypothetical protein VSU01S_30580 [Vibrio superstes NBRC 103154]|uniref:Uncharacterized protein n=1 Tax=Vibrio superstes NBRC 103154 TaxID=1219062 RepID=A0A511QTX5_9VIBR|nr:hypothetical protein VSU01S_30580 [Vibrio superstes NBRC 103154]
MLLLSRRRWIHRWISELSMNNLYFGATNREGRIFYQKRKKQIPLHFGASKPSITNYIEKEKI